MSQVSVSQDPPGPMACSTSTPFAIDHVLVVPTGIQPIRLSDRAGLLAQAIQRFLRDQFNDAANDILDVECLERVVEKVTQIATPAIANRLPCDDVDSKRSMQDYAITLCRLSQLVGNQPADAIQSSYIEQLLLATILPIYLRSSTQPISIALDNSRQLAYEHLLVLALDRLLAGELVQAIDEVLRDSSLQTNPPRSNRSNLHSQPPIVVATELLSIDLHKVMSLSHPSLGPTINNNQRDGYWSIARQWIERQEAIAIPAQLAAGNVSWSRIRVHWEELSYILRNDSSTSASGSIPNLKSNGLGTSNSGAAGSLRNKNGVVEEASVPTVIEIRSSNDPELARMLDLQLQRCRDRAGSLALAVVRCDNSRIGQENVARIHPASTLAVWQVDLIRSLQLALDQRGMYGFYTTSGDLALIIEDVERGEVTSMLRVALETEGERDEEEARLLEHNGLALFSGVACVNAPSKAFKLAQLTDSAWRCLEASLRQSPGAVKGIEVY